MKRERVVGEGRRGGNALFEEKNKPGIATLLQISAVTSEVHLLLSPRPLQLRNLDLRAKRQPPTTGHPSGLEDLLDVALVEHLDTLLWKSHHEFGSWE